MIGKVTATLSGTPSSEASAWPVVALSQNNEAVQTITAMTTQKVNLGKDTLIKPQAV